MWVSKERKNQFSNKQRMEFDRETGLFFLSSFFLFTPQHKTHKRNKVKAMVTIDKARLKALLKNFKESQSEGERDKSHQESMVGLLKRTLKKKKEYSQTER